MSSKVAKRKKARVSVAIDYEREALYYAADMLELDVDCCEYPPLLDEDEHSVRFREAVEKIVSELRARAKGGR